MGILVGVLLVSVAGSPTEERSTSGHNEQLISSCRGSSYCYYGLSSSGRIFAYVKGCVNWPYAKDFCKQMGGEFGIALNKSDFEDVMQLMQTIPSVYSQYFWFGAKVFNDSVLIDSNGEDVTGDLEPFLYTGFWTDVKTNNNGNEMCIKIYSYGMNLWSYPCIYAQCGFLCSSIRDSQTEEVTTDEDSQGTLQEVEDEAKNDQALTTDAE